MILELQFIFGLLVISVQGKDWSYAGNTAPSNWKGTCNAGRSQSPINIPRNNNSQVTEDPFVFTNYDRTPNKSFLKNLGKTIEYKCQTKEPNMMPKVSGGGLPGEFEFAQFHLHFGSVERVGSEHTINKISYPAELHMVHFNKAYGDDIQSAIENGKGAQDTLAVLGILFKLQNDPNDNLDAILNVVKDVSDPDMETEVKLFPLQDLLPLDRSKFFRYNGSLTTPGCNEIVVWTVFQDFVDVSLKQLGALRKLYTATPQMKDNFRPIQPLNGRQILEVTTAAYSGSETIKTISLMNIPIIALTFSLALGSKLLMLV